jgi:alpha-L-fucosidase
MRGGPVFRAVAAHQVPAWWLDAKFGIFVHWTPASVPGFAPTDNDIAGLLARRDSAALASSPYTEWYENSLRFAGSQVARFHAEQYRGEPYASFGPRWEAALSSWDPSAWVRDFVAAGARYVVLVAKHHDGWCLWPTDVANPNRTGWASRRDVVGELAEAVRAAGLRFGLYYSGGLDWAFDARPIGRFSDLLAAQPTGVYADYAEAQVRELIDRYRPAVLWNDISWPTALPRLARLLADYYDAVPDGLVNDRFVPRSALWRLCSLRPARWLIDVALARASAREQGLIPPKPPLFDVRTPEYASFDKIQSTPWESVRGMDKSFGYNRSSTEADFLTRQELLWSFADIVAKGGNLLLNVGPRGEDAHIPEPQRRRLGWMADFMADGAAALRGTRPWHTSGIDTSHAEVRYAARDDDLVVVARRRGHGGAGTRLSLPDVGSATSARTVSGPLAITVTGAGTDVELATPLDDETPTVLTLSGAVLRAAG